MQAPGAVATTVTRKGYAEEFRSASQIGSGYDAPARVMFVLNEDRSFLTHRCTWALAFAQGGSHVTVLAEDTGAGPEIEALGFEFIPVVVGREAIRLRACLVAVCRILVEVCRQRPQVVFLSTTAAYTLGWLPALFLRRTRFVRIITGAGRALDSLPPQSLKGRLIRLLISRPSRLENVWSLFQIEEDCESFVSSGLACRARSQVVPGTGIEVDAWQTSEPVEVCRIVLFAGRLFREKGVYEFVEIARKVRRIDQSIRFVIVGSPDEGVTTAVTRSELVDWARDGVVEYWGHQSDMRSVFAQTCIVVMPTRHPEGTPKILVEAAACGVPAVVSDRPGCKAVVADGVSGRVLSLSDLDVWVSTIRSLLSDEECRARMSAAAQQKVREEFSLEVVLPRILEFAGVSERKEARVP